MAVRFRHDFSASTLRASRPPVKIRTPAPARASGVLVLVLVLALALPPALALTLTGEAAADPGPAPAAAADPAGTSPASGPWAVGLEIGILKLGEGQWDYSNADRFAGLSLQRSLARTWSLRLSLRHGYVRPGVDRPGLQAGWTTAGFDPYHTVITQPSLSLEHRFAPASILSPFLGFGLGLTSWRVISGGGGSPGWFPDGDPVAGFDIEGRPATLQGRDLAIVLDLGAELRLGSRLGCLVRGVYQVTPGNDLDNVGLSGPWGPDQADANRSLSGGMVGLTWRFGSADADGDGVPDAQDHCPGAQEDEDGYNDMDGCPDPDNDGDGVADAQDACPNLAEDRDGWQDRDGCPELDNDGDRIRDGRDGCPDEPEDADGFEDQDGCPDPDNDRDGVPDERDLCPFTQPGAAVDADGCPVSP